MLRSFVYLLERDLLWQRCLPRQQCLLLGHVLPCGHAGQQQRDLLPQRRNRLRLPELVAPRLSQGLLRRRPPLLLLGRDLRHRRQHLLCRGGQRGDHHRTAGLPRRRGALWQRVLLGPQLLLRRAMHQRCQHLLRWPGLRRHMLWQQLHPGWRDLLPRRYGLPGTERDLLRLRGLRRRRRRLWRRSCELPSRLSTMCGHRAVLPHG